MNRKCVTPAAANSFTVVETSKKLSVNKANYFLWLVARLLFASKRARSDLQTAVAYLCTRVKCPNEADCDKLHQVIKYIRIATIYLQLLLGWDELGRSNRAMILRLPYTTIIGHIQERYLRLEKD